MGNYRHIVFFCQFAHFQEISLFWGVGRDTRVDERTDIHIPKALRSAILYMAENDGWCLFFIFFSKSSATSADSQKSSADLGLSLPHIQPRYSHNNDCFHVHCRHADPMGCDIPFILILIVWTQQNSSRIHIKATVMRQGGWPFYKLVCNMCFASQIATRT